MNIYCLGDSLTEGDYGVYKKKCIANVKEKNYPYFLAQLSNANVVNMGHCGYNATMYYNNCCVKQRIDISDADYILIMLGTNGGLREEERIQNFKAYDEIINYCKTLAPNAKIVLITPPFRSLNPENSNAIDIDYLKDVRKCVIKSAEKYSLPIIDVYSFEEFCEDNVPIYQTNDGLHFVEKGYHVLAIYIYEFLCKLFPEDF